jgi:hypothetical protein
LFSIFKKLKTRNMEKELHDVITKAYVNHRIITDDDLAMILEATPLLYKMIDAVNEDMEAHHRNMEKGLQFPILFNAFYYMFAKGAEAAYLWNALSAEEFKNTSVNYLFNDLLEGRVGLQVDDKFNGDVTALSGLVYDAFVDVQDWIVANFENLKKSSTVPDIVRQVLRSSALAGVDFGMRRLGFE